jgi:uncharacterized protein (DUF58 family)
LLVVAFYALGTGFEFFYRFLYVLLLLLGIGLFWAWIGLRGLEVQLTRTGTRGQVGENLEGRVRITNRTRMPKSWLEVVEVSDLPGHIPGRALALVRDQIRAWRTQTYLSRRGLYHIGQVEVTSQDPFGLFRFRRSFLQSKPFIVLPATEPLPDLDQRFASLPSDSRVTRHSDQITTDVASVRHYSHGDSFRRIHWPYTARMNSLMVKEFDMGLSAEAWVLLDMQEGVQGQDEADAEAGSKELAVTIAASLVESLAGLGMPVGLAAAGDQRLIFRPNSSPEHLGRLMEALAVVQAAGKVPLERFIYDLRPNMSRFNTVTVITSAPGAKWVAALTGMRRQGVTVAAVLVDPRGFGASAGVEAVLHALSADDIPTYVARRGQPLNESLRSPVNRPAGRGATAPKRLPDRRGL